MISLDIRTIIFGNLIASVVCLLVMVSLWRRSRRRFAGLDWLVADFTLQTAAMFLIMARGLIPDWSSTLLANTLVIIGAWAGYRGLERFVGKPGPQIHNYLLLVLFPAVFAYYTYVKPDLAVRSLCTSTGLLILCFQCMWLLLHRTGPGIRPLATPAGLVFGGFCLVNAIRIGEFLAGPPPAADYLHSGTFQALVLAAYQMLMLFLTYSLVLMVNRRLLLEIETQEEKFSKAFHSAPYGIILTRMSDGRIMDVNEGFLKISGLQYPEAAGQTTVGLHLWHREADRASVLQDLTASGQVRGREFQFRNKAGGTVTGLISADIIQIGNEQHILTSISDITERKHAETEREKLIGELREALAKVKQLSGLLPICASCKKIRDDQGYWTQAEAYIESHSEVEFSHGFCPECVKKLYPEYELDRTASEREHP